MDIEYNIFYQKKKELIFFSKKYELELNENLETITFGKNTIICQFTVKYNDKIQFQFDLKCEPNPEKCFAVKNKKKIDITYDTETFIENCKKYIEKLNNDFDKISKKFYASINYDIISLKIPPNKKNIYQVKIILDMDNVYTLKINNFDMIYFDNLEEVIDCNDIQTLKKTIWNNILHFFYIF